MIIPLSLLHLHYSTLFSICQVFLVGKYKKFLAQLMYKLGKIPQSIKDYF